MVQAPNPVIQSPTNEDAYITEDALMSLGSDAMVEVVDGKVVKRSPAGGRHQLIGGNIFEVLDQASERHQSGYVFFFGLLFILAKRGKGLKGARVPDVSYVSKADIPADWNVDKPFPGAPTLAVEIMSPDDKAEAVNQRVQEFLEAGSTEVWVVYPKTKQIVQYKRADRATAHVYDSGSTLDLSDLFPNVSLPLDAVFALPDLK